MHFAWLAEAQCRWIGVRAYINFGLGESKQRYATTVELKKKNLQHFFNVRIYFLFAFQNEFYLEFSLFLNSFWHPLPVHWLCYLFCGSYARHSFTHTHTFCLSLFFSPRYIRKIAEEKKNAIKKGVSKKETEREKKSRRRKTATQANSAKLYSRDIRIMNERKKNVVYVAKKAANENVTRTEMLLPVSELLRCSLIFFFRSFFACFFFFFFFV